MRKRDEEERDLPPAHPAVVRRFFSKTKRNEVGCLLWTGADKGGRYGSFYFNGKPQKAHRVAFFLHHRRWPEPCALHHCDVSLCVEVTHLFEGTQLENIEDMRRKGRASRKARFAGEYHPEVKLTERDCDVIRRSGLGGVVLSKKFGVSPSLVSMVRRGLRRTVGSHNGA